MRTDVCGNASVAPRLAACDSGPKAVDQDAFHQRLGKIALDPQSPHALHGSLSRSGGDEDRWDRVPSFDQMFVKLDTRHYRHVNIGDQARCDSESG